MLHQIHRIAEVMNEEARGFQWHQQPLYRWMIRKINVSLFDGSQWNPSNESLVRK